MSQRLFWVLPPHTSSGSPAADAKIVQSNCHRSAHTLPTPCAAHAWWQSCPALPNASSVRGGEGGSGDGGGSGGDGGGDGGDGGLVGGGSDGGLVGGDGGGGGAAGRFARLSAASPIALPIRKSDSAFQPQWYP